MAKTATTTQVAGVSNIRYELANEGKSVRLLFDEPSDTAGIEAYEIEFSKDGTIWEKPYKIGVGSNYTCPITDMTRGMEGSTTYNKVRVTSLAKEGYTQNAAIQNISYAFTVTGDAPVFKVKKTADGEYTITLTGGSTADAIYVLDVTTDDNTAKGYPIGFSIPSPAGNEFTIGEANADSPILDGSAFVLKMIKPYTTTGMTVTNKSAEVTVSSAATTATPVISRTPTAGDTIITGTCVSNVTVMVSINGGTAAEATVTDTSWKIIVTALEKDDEISVVATKAPDTVSITATATVTYATFCSVPSDTTLAHFKASIRPTHGGSFEVYEENGTIVATDLKTGYKLIIIGEDGIATTTCTIVFQAERPGITNYQTSVTTTVGTLVTLDATATVSDGGTISYAWYSNITESASGGTE